MIKVVISCAVLLLPLTFAAAGECGAKNSVTVDKIEGTAKVSDDQKNWTPLAKGTQVGEKSFVKTEAKSNLLLQFPDGSTMKVGESSLINMSSIATNASCERESFKVKMFFGKIWSNVKKVIASKDDKSFVVESKNAVAGVRGTSFGFVVNPDESGALLVATGAVAIEPVKKEEPAKKPMDIQAWKKNRSRQEVAGPSAVTKEEWDKIVVEAMQMVKFSANGVISKPVPIGTSNADSWYLENKPQ